MYSRSAQRDINEFELWLFGGNKMPNDNPLEDLRNYNPIDYKGKIKDRAVTLEEKEKLLKDVEEEIKKNDMTVGIFKGILKAYGLLKVFL